MVRSHLKLGETSCRIGVRISDVVEVGQVEYLSESVPARDQPCSITTISLRSPGKRKRKRSPTLAPAARPKRLFEFDDESIILPKGRWVYFEDPNFKCALKSQEKLLHLVRVVAVVVLRPSFNQVPDK